MIVGRMNGIIEVVNFKTEELIMTMKAFDLAADATDKTREKFVGVHIVDG